MYATYLFQFIVQLSLADSLIQSHAQTHPCQRIPLITSCNNLLLTMTLFARRLTNLTWWVFGGDTYGMFFRSLEWSCWTQRNVVYFVLTDSLTLYVDRWCAFKDMAKTLADVVRMSIEAGEMMKQDLIEVSLLCQSVVILIRQIKIVVI